MNRSRRYCVLNSIRDSKVLPSQRLCNRLSYKFCLCSHVDSTRSDAPSSTSKKYDFNGEVLIQSARTAMVVRPVCRWETRQLLSHLFRTYLGASLSVASDSDFDGSTIAILPECGRVILQPFGRYHSRALARNTKRMVYVMTVFDA